VTTPLRILGGYRSGKTTRLRELAAQHERPLVVCATQAAADAFGHPNATTFWGLASDVLARHDTPVRILSTAEHCARVGDDDLAHAVSHYTASFLGREELRTHAHAAGVFVEWEAVADAAERCADEPDWAGVLVKASLLLRDEDRLRAERERFDVILVDDFEAASFATNLLLSQLAGFGGPVVVAGNPGNVVWRHVAGSPVYLDRFPRRFGAVADDVRLDQQHGPDGDGHVVLSLAPGGDPWLPLPLPDDGPVPVALATSLTWASTEIVRAPPAPLSRYDLDVLAGPDVPDDDVKAARRAAEDAARLALARTRAAQTTVQPPSM